MEKIGYIFPGQGVQYVGMGKDLYENFESARSVFDKANKILDIDIKKFCFEGPQEQLGRTDISQPAILTTSIAALRVLEKEIPNFTAIPPRTSGNGDLAQSDVAAVAGLSLGEYTALVAVGSISFEAAISLVRKRGQFMEEASRKKPGGMLSIIGLPKDEVENLCRQTGTQIANLNCPGQIVISGMLGGISTVYELIRLKGAKRVVRLGVSGPFHSRFMDYASKKLRIELEAVEILPPSLPVIANVTAKAQAEPQIIRENLINQVNHSVLWEEAVRLMASDGIITFLEIGPGKVLKGLLRKIDPNLKVLNIGTVADVEKLKTQMSQGGS